MGRGVGHHAGGIAGLLRLLREHEGAVRRDLLCAGLRLDEGGTERLSWADLLAFCRWSPVESAIYAAQNPDHIPVDTRLLRSIEHSQRWLVWVKTTDAKHGRNQPKPWPLNEVEVEEQNPHAEQYEQMTTDDMDAFLGWSPRSA